MFSAALPERSPSSPLNPSPAPTVDGDPDGDEVVVVDTAGDVVVDGDGYGPMFSLSGDIGPLSAGHKTVSDAHAVAE